MMNNAKQPLLTSKLERIEREQQKLIDEIELKIVNHEHRINLEYTRIHNLLIKFSICIANSFVDIAAESCHFCGSYITDGYEKCDHNLDCPYPVAIDILNESTEVTFYNGLWCLLSDIEDVEDV